MHNSPNDTERTLDVLKSQRWDAGFHRSELGEKLMQESVNTSTGRRPAGWKKATLAAVLATSICGVGFAAIGGFDGWLVEVTSVEQGENGATQIHFQGEDGRKGIWESLDGDIDVAVGDQFTMQFIEGSGDGNAAGQMRLLQTPKGITILAPGGVPDGMGDGAQATLVTADGLEHEVVLAQDPVNEPARSDRPAPCLLRVMVKTAQGLRPWQTEKEQEIALIAEDAEGSTIELKLAVKMRFGDEG